MKEFWEDKEREESSIKDTIRLLEKQGYQFIRENDDNKYDILFRKDNKDLKIEVKQDFSCFKTSNVGVEYHCRGKVSGIMVSEANYYVYKLHQNPNFLPKEKEIKTLLINKEKLKDCIKQIIKENENETDYKNELENQGLVYKSPFKESKKRNFNIRKVFNKETGEYYEVSIRNINGGDMGSNSLNMLFERHIFIKHFAIEVLESRNRTEQETKDLEETINNREIRKKKRYG